MYVNSDVARRILSQTQPTDEKFSGQWKDHYTKKFMYALAEDGTYAINTIGGWNPLAVGISEFECDYDCGEKPNLVRVLATGEVHFTDGLWESFKATIQPQTK